MISKDALESRLVQWAKEYGGGKYENIGYSSKNILQVLIEHKGFNPDSRGYVPTPINTAADEIEKLVADMEQSGWFKQGRVLRVDYFLPQLSIEHRLQKLRIIGLGMSRAGYYDYLAQAKAFIAGALVREVA